MSIEAFNRIFWIVLDGMGIEHARLFLQAGRSPALERIARDGYLEGSAPSSPACQTPTALLALFTGAGPRESGVWGYLMPDPRRPEETISGFSAPTRDIRTIWDELGDRGRTFSLMNVAFRRDRVWSGSLPGLDFGYDGYRTWKKSRVYHLPRGVTPIEFQGIELDLLRSRGRVVVRKGSRTRAILAPGIWQTIALTGGTRAYACLLDEGHVALAPLTRPLVRGTCSVAAAADDFIDFNIFKTVRALNHGRDAAAKIPLATQMAPAALGMRQKVDLMIQATRCASTQLVIGYFPIIDELNHARFDLLDMQQPDAETIDVYMACAALVDDMVSQVMAEADRDTLVVLSSDHGISAFRRTLHVNELFADAGLVRRSRDGYDLRRSAAMYHPSECGIVHARPGADRAAVLAGIRRALSRAAELGVQVGMEEGRGDDPFVAFLHPLSDAYLAARAPRRGRPAIDGSRSGGQHQSSLAPTPWIQAMLGLWSPRTTTLARDLGGVPSANTGVKEFLLRMLEGD